jgi:predicted nuclease of predicted toxin-antitoxin system
MKLLFDNNLSHKLVERLSDLFPQSSHVMNEGMDESSDHKIWQFAKAKGYSIITKDIDYNALSVLYGIHLKSFS